MGFWGFGVLGNKLEHIAGFFNGLGGGGCGGCSSSCGSPGCGSQYVPASNPCSSGGCYSSSCSTCGSSASSYSAPAAAHPSNTITVIVQQPSSSSVYDASAYPNCQCSYLFNTHGQGNCNGQGSRSYTSDRCAVVSLPSDMGYLLKQFYTKNPHPKLRHRLTSDRLRLFLSPLI